MKRKLFTFIALLFIVGTVGTASVIEQDVTDPQTIFFDTQEEADQYIQSNGGSITLTNCHYEFRTFADEGAEGRLYYVCDMICWYGNFGTYCGKMLIRASYP